MKEKRDERDEHLMGFDLDERVIVIRTSAHNSEKDDFDRHLRDAFIIALNELMKKFRDVGLDIQYGVMR